VATFENFNRGTKTYQLVPGILCEVLFSRLSRIIFHSHLIVKMNTANYRHHCSTIKEIIQLEFLAIARVWGVENWFTAPKIFVWNPKYTRLCHRWGGFNTIHYKKKMKMTTNNKASLVVT
jgi:hypothetical protein